jgi:uncharacterized protein (TIGR03437 family)
MRARAAIFAASLGATFTAAQAPIGPVIVQRGVYNEFAMLPAPAAVAPGGLLRVTGLNLGPAEEWTSKSTPLPLAVGDPPVQVLINGRPAPLVLVSPSRVICQVPMETPPGVGAVVVQRGELRSRPARFFVRNPVPALLTESQAGFGPAKFRTVDGKLIFEATGLGPTEPPAVTGEPAAAEPAASPALPVRLHLNGIELKIQVRLSTEKPGVFEISGDPPARQRPGDSLQLFVANRPANPATLGSAVRTTSRFLPLPDGAPEIRAIGSSALNTDLVLASGARGEDGCYPALLLDFERSSSNTQPGCLTAPNRTAPGPVVSPAESPAMATYLGPAVTPEPGQGFSPNLRIFHPAAEKPLDVSLPAPALGIVTAPDGALIAVTPGEQARGYRIDPLSGEFAEIEVQGGGNPTSPANPQPGIANLQIDLGDGLNKVLGVINTGIQGIVAVVVGNDLDNPTKAKLAAVRLPGPEVLGSRDFPDGWLPVVSPGPPIRPGQPPPANRLGVTMWIDGGTRRLYLPMRAVEGAKDAMAAISLEDESAQTDILPLPDGWFYASCTPNLRFFNLELSRRMAMFASRTQEKSFRQLCGANGYLLFDLAAMSVSALELAGQGQLNVAAGADELNDYIYGINSDPSLQGAADTMYVLDGVRGDTFRIDLPGVSSFNQTRPVPDTNLILGIARNTVAGDAGFVLFDLDRAEASLLPTPDGFTAVQIQGFLPGVRKVVARGTLEAGGGTRIVLYDYKEPANPEVTVVPNPEGVRWVGNAPADRPQPGQPAPQPGPLLLLIHGRTNSILTMGYGDDRKQRGLIQIRAN